VYRIAGRTLPSRRSRPCAACCALSIRCRSRHARRARAARHRAPWDARAASAPGFPGRADNPPVLARRAAPPPW